MKQVALRVARLNPVVNTLKQSFTVLAVQDATVLLEAFIRLPHRHGFFHEGAIVRRVEEGDFFWNLAGEIDGDLNDFPREGFRITRFDREKLGLRRNLHRRSWQKSSPDRRADSFRREHGVKTERDDHHQQRVAKSKQRLPVDRLIDFDMRQRHRCLFFQRRHDLGSHFAVGGFQVDIVQQRAVEFGRGIFDRLRRVKLIDALQPGHHDFPADPGQCPDQQQRQQTDPPQIPEAARHDPVVKHDKHQQIRHHGDGHATGRREDIGGANSLSGLLQLKPDVLVEFGVRFFLLGASSSCLCLISHVKSSERSLRLEVEVGCSEQSVRNRSTARDPIGRIVPPNPITRKVAVRKNSQGERRLLSCRQDAAAATTQLAKRCRFVRIHPAQPLRMARPAKAVVQCPAEPDFRERPCDDLVQLSRVEPSQRGKELRGRGREVAVRGEDFFLSKHGPGIEPRQRNRTEPHSASRELTEIDIVDQRERRSRCVVLSQHSWRRSGLRIGRIARRAYRADGTDHLFKLLLRHASVAKQPRGRFGHQEDRRLDADKARTAVEDQVDSLTERRGDVPGGCRTELPERIGTWRGDRQIDFQEQLAGLRMRRHPNGHRRQAGRHQVRHQIRLRQNERQRSRPERLHQSFGERTDLSGELRQPFRIGNVDDERVKMRPVLCLENSRHGFRVESVCPEPVHRLGPERDEAAFAQRARSEVDVSRDRAGGHRLRVRRERHGGREF